MSVKLESTNMSMFTCFVLCAVAVSRHSVYAVEDANDPRDDFRPMVEDCAKQYGYTISELEKALIKSDLSNIEPCFWGCAFTKAGFLNSHKQYDLNSGLTHIRKWALDPRGYAIIEKVAKQCESVKDIAVSDDEAGCARGTLAAICFLEKLQSAPRNNM